MNTLISFDQWRPCACTCLLVGLVAGFWASVSASEPGVSYDEKSPIYFANSNCLAKVKAVSDKDGGVYALLLTITNLSTNNMVLHLTDAPDFNIRLDIHIPGKDGGLVSKPNPDFHTFEFHQVQMKIAPEKQVDWFIPITDYLKESGKVPEQTKALIGVFLFAYIEAEGSDVRQNASLNFFREDVTLTRQSLQARAADKYQRQLNKEN